ncbi:MAG: hypothetical protein EOM67_07880 [Spirochaetia bacterium]|nr:hypothetical protein [Spirochaetia bacterium]
MMDQNTLLEVIKKFNSDQQEAILCDTNCVVTAGAGSGKTSVLTYRFFSLVATGKADVDQILTLTFTKAAAAQMYGRIYDLFIAYKDDEHIKEQLEKFSSSTISTIDSFCYSIVSSDLRRFGLSPDFILDNDASVEIAQMCAHQTIIHFKDDPAIQFLIEAYNPEVLTQEVLVSLAIENFYLGDEFHPYMCVNIVEEYLTNKQENAIIIIKEIVQQLLSFNLRGSVASKNKEFLEYLNKVISLPFSSFVLEVRNIKNSKRLTKSSVKEAEKEEYNRLVEEGRDLLDQLVSLTLAIEQKAVLPGMYELFSYFHDLYIESKRKGQVLTYNDIAHMAKIVLVENEVLRKKFSSLFTYIMVDEFQDTNSLQKQIIYLLATTEPVVKEIPVSATSLAQKKLFFVGDEKQSIYRFRGADVRVFKGLHEEIISSGGSHIRLKKNYRSQTPLINIFNSLFSNILSHSSESFEASFDPLEGVKENPSIISKASLAIIPYEENNPTTIVEGDDISPVGVEKEALYIANKIRAMVETDEYLIEEDGEVKRPSYKDIAILLRTTSSQMYYEKALRSAHIPYVLSSVKSLFLEAPLNDIYNMLNLIVYSEDFVSYASLLRSGFCNIDDLSLITLLERAREEHSIFSEIELSDNSEDEKYERVKELYSTLLVMSKNQNISSLVTYLWYNGGYRNHLLTSPLYRVYLEHFDYIVELTLDIERKGGNLLSFLDYVRPRLGKSEKMGELEILSDDSNGVNIMTIHKSKGLEFPIVIIANAGGGSIGMKTPEVFYHEYLDTLIPVPRHMKEDGVYKNILFEHEKGLLEKSEQAELKRLLYVAFTRAQFHLLVTSYDNNRNLNEKLQDKNFLSMISFYSAQSIDGLTNEIVEGYELEDKELLSRRKIIKEALSKKDWYMQGEEEIPYIHKVVGVTSLSKVQETKDDNLLILKSYESDDVLEKYHIYNLFGTWTHALFEYAITHLGPSFSYDEALLNKEVAMSIMPSEFKSVGVTEGDITVLIRDMLMMVNSFFASPFYHSLLTAQLVLIESEVPFIAKVNYEGEEVVVSGIIDLLLEYENSIIILDFKTDKIVDPSIHKTQLELYIQAMKKIYEKEMKAVLCYVRECGNEKWL